jgi:hypothetical protein
MKEEILEYIKTYDFVSFVELCKEIEGFSGEGTFENEDLNIIFWQGVSQEGFDTMHELQEEKLIKPEWCSPMLYIIDGLVIDLPVAKSIRKYKDKRWCPVVWRLK